MAVLLADSMAERMMSRRTFKTNTTYSIWHVATAKRAMLSRAMLKRALVTVISMMMATASMAVADDALPSGVETSPSIASQGMVSVSSQFSVKDTADRFEAILQKKGLTLFARVDHARNAAGVELSLRPTELIIFGNPKVGTPLMQCAQQVAIDLPQKALIWQDEEGQVWFSYNAPAFIQARHQIEGCESVLTKISGVLGKLSQAATR